MVDNRQDYWYAHRVQCWSAEWNTESARDKAGSSKGWLQNPVQIGFYGLDRIKSLFFSYLTKNVVHGLKFYGQKTDFGIQLVIIYHYNL